MNLKDKKLLVTRPYKVVYQDGDRIIKVFTLEHGKANVFNEALCTARVEESGLDIPPVLEVTQIDGEWAIAIQYVEGETLEAKMNGDPIHIKTYMEQFVDVQLSMHAKKAPRLTLQKDKFARKIASLKDSIDATTRYELNTRLESMPRHTRLCHGDFNPSNVIVRGDGTMTIVDWAHATQGNASGDAAITYLQFALKNQKLADLYLELFCKKSDTAKQYVQKWLPIAAAAQLTRGIPEEEKFLRRWTDIIDFQ
ncbi:MAG: aminoglycoside phosphotransferase family protein [Clostridiales bacterium]|nr:aminoglycoside phosphotransferase family protein [Clostridiales bacterium]MCD8154338.1 aminoglycoside phosphotransferase family protein [Clostridiales bacterium]